jgi:hypothetical protein
MSDDERFDRDRRDRGRQRDLRGNIDRDGRQDRPPRRQIDEVPPELYSIHRGKVVRVTDFG